MKLLVIANPHAGGGRAAKLLERISDALGEVGGEVELLQTTGRGHATALVARHDLRPYDALIAAGGDGTLNEVVNGLCRLPPLHRRPLGVIPVGTGNAFARELGLLSGQWREAVDLIALGTTRRIDIARVETHGDTFFYLNTLGIGLVVDAALAALRLKWIGTSAYTLGTLWQLLWPRHHPLVIECDGRTTRQDSLLVEISNTRYTGTSFLIAPGAVMDDGLLDVMLVRKASRLRLLPLLLKVYSGRHIGCAAVSVQRAGTIRITAPAGLPLAPDGEVRGTTPAVITCLQRELEILAPVPA